MIVIFNHIYIITFRIFFVRYEGPLLEKNAAIGAGLESMTVTVGRIVATGFLQINHMQK